MSEPEEGFRIVTQAEIEEFFRKPGLSHFVGMINPPRPGVTDCLKTLEHTHYPPGTPKNELISMVLLRWQEIDWVVATIPSTDYNRMQSAAHANGLRIVRGVPVILSGDGMEQFPITARRLYVLENTPSHPVYKNQRQRRT